MSKKVKNTTQFPDYLLRDWEITDGVNFAIALSRITDWLLHVDWWTPTDSDESVENMKSLRVYLANNSTQVYDFRGKQSLSAFTNNLILPLARKRGLQSGGIATRYYSESKLFTLPLRVKPDESKILAAQKIIVNNKDFLEKIPKRQAPNVPAHIAAQFTYGYCNPFANALSDLMGYRPMALIAKSYSQLFSKSRLGYIHSFAYDYDGNAVDIWGKDTVENIANRFGVTKYELDDAEHNKVSQGLKNNSPQVYKQAYEWSVNIVNEYFVQ